MPFLPQTSPGLSNVDMIHALLKTAFAWCIDFPDGRTPFKERVEFLVGLLSPERMTDGGIHKRGLAAFRKMRFAARYCICERWLKAQVSVELLQEN